MRKETDSMKKAFLFTLLILTSCASYESGQDLSAADVAWIRAGGTTKAEVIERFGLPDATVGQFGGNQVMTWRHIESEADAFNASMLNPFNTKIDTNLKTEQIEITVSPDGLVLRAEYFGGD
jgi:hypothetical protein